MLKRFRGINEVIRPGISVHLFFVYSIFINCTDYQLEFAVEAVHQTSSPSTQRVLLAMENSQKSLNVEPNEETELLIKNKQENQNRGSYHSYPPPCVVS